MMIFFKRLPVGTRKSDIEDFIADAVKGRLFSRAGQIKNINIIERRNPHLNVTDYHGVVTIEPDSVAARVIKKLHGKLFKGKYIEVRRYYLRKAANDPRRKRGVDEVPDNRRRSERRQSTEGLGSALSFDGIKDFSRKG